MDELEQFEAVLRELGELMLDLGDLASRVMLIGGQALALEARKRGRSGMIEVETDTGDIVPRGFTLEPDLLFDLEGSVFAAERLLEVLQQRGYQRVRTYRWSKELRETAVQLDLFAPEGVDPDALPTFMTPLPDAHLVLRRQQRIELNIRGRALRIAIPDAVGFLAMKTRAKFELRPKETKDSFDIFAYVKLVGVGTVLDALRQAGQEGWAIQKKLRELFYMRSSSGVQDVVAYASTLESEQQALLEQAVVDLFAEFF